MKDISCLLAGLARLLGPIVIMLLWRKRTKARLLPAVVALALCFPVFMLANALRSGFDYSSSISFYIQQGLLYAVFEETAKYIAMRFILSDYDECKDAVTYSIGHGAYEDLGGGVSCFKLIGKGIAHPMIFPLNFWALFEGTISGAASCIMILYGIRTDKARIMLPLAIVFHAVSSVVMNVFIELAAVIISTLLTGIKVYIALRCREAMQIPPINETEQQL